MTKIPPKSHESHVDVKDLKWNTIYFFLEDNKTIAATDSLKLVQHFSPLVSEKINNDTLSGVFYYPADSSNLPLFILVSSGSGGASYQARQSAKIIADHGFASLVLFYSGTKLLPQHLEKIPLEYFFNAFDWIKKKPMIESSKIVLCGGSKGGELVLLLASMRPDIKAVIAVEPSCVLWQGMPYNPWTVFFPRPAWLYKGKALPYLDHKLDLSIMMKFGTGARQIELCRLYSEVLDDKKNVEKALIEVENINGPVLLIAGKDQQVWPAYRMCRMIEQRLDSLDFNYPVKGLYYENAGHNVTAPDLPPTIDYKYEQIKTGGTHAGNAAAQQHSWNEVIKFLKTCFKK